VFFDIFQILRLCAVAVHAASCYEVEACSNGKPSLGEFLMSDKPEPDSIHEPKKPVEDDDIIELTELADIVPESKVPVLELSDVLSDSSQAAQFDRDMEGVDDLIPDEETPPENERNQPGELEAFSLEYELDTIAEEENGDDFTHSLGLHLEEAGASVEETALQETTGPSAPTISTEQIEAALERIIERMLADKIEKIINEVLEKAVSREMQRLKTIFMETS